MRHSVHSGRLRALLAAGAAFAVLGAAPAAHAATVSGAGGTLNYVAAAGETNHVTIAPWGLVLKVTDTGTKRGAPIALTSGSGCWRLSSSSAACGGTATVVTASLGDGDDFIDARDGKIDTIACGAGADSGSAETSDSVGADCEAVAKPALVEPPSTPVTVPVVDPPTDPVIDPPVVDPELPADPPLAPVGNSVPPTIPPQTVGVSASGVANVLVVCPPDSGGCSGVVTIQLPGAASRRHAKVSATRRNAAPLSIGRARFKAAAGSSKSVPVRLSKRGRQRILRGRRTRARINVTTRSASGRTTVSSQDVTIRPRPRGKGRKAPRR
jgi:hypothetical protein